MSTYEERSQRLSDQLRASSGGIGLSKDTSNLFRDREEEKKEKLNVRDFNHVLEVNTQQHWVDVEGMTTYEKLVEETLKHGELPAVVPQLKSITIGGAVSGVGIEASSFKFGLVHETILEMDVLLADGSIVTATPENEHKDLFFGLPNSYGTFGYILRVRAKTVATKKFVHLTYTHFDNSEKFFDAVSAACSGDADFVDGVVFDEKNMTLVVSRFTDNAPYVSDYTFMKIFYKSICNRSEDFLTAKDFIWRWDTDWFWCSRYFGLENPLLRFLWGKKRLNSITYSSIMRWNAKHKFMDKVERFRKGFSESIIQDICIPIRNAPSFLSILHKEIGILPIWICPTRNPTNHVFPLFNAGNELGIDFGFWDSKRTTTKYEQGHFNTLLERETAALGGLKSLYSSSYFDRETFWKTYDGEAYRALKAKYDPQGRLKDLYEKCVLKK